jgi:hypothetical protein
MDKNNLMKKIKLILDKIKKIFKVKNKKTSSGENIFIYK